MFPEGKVCLIANVRKLSLFSPSKPCAPAFQELPADERTETGILVFYGRLYKHEHHRELLPCSHDAYQFLKVDLGGLYKLS